jgi:hypothetical protein
MCSLKGTPSQSDECGLPSGNQLSALRRPREDEALPLVYVGFGDLAARWVYTLRGVRKLVMRQDFPVPAFTINGGRTKVWTMADIDVYERLHPEVTSPEAKRRKIAGYAIALAKKRKQA